MEKQPNDALPNMSENVSPINYPGSDGGVYSSSIDNQDNVKQIIVTKTEITSGPLPHPDLVEKYNEVIPNGAERIMRMAELQQENRFIENRETREINKEIAMSKLKYFKRGQLMGFILAFVLLGLATLFVFTGYENMAYLLFSVGALSLVGIFVKSSLDTKK